MGIDTIFPHIYRPTFLDFEQSIAWTTKLMPNESRDYIFRHEHNKWLASKYPFRLNTMMLLEGQGAMSVCWHLGSGCYLHTNNMSPITGEFGEDPKWLYLVLAYQHKEEWDGRATLLPRIKKWIRHLEEMPNCNVEAVFARATDCSSHKYRHLRMTKMRTPVNASSERLSKCYKKYFGAKEWEYKDCDGIPYLKWKFCPKFPKK
jgi:hypothetical protein